MSKWFEADRDGLRQVAERLVERRGFGIIAGELYQNVMDTDATECNITIEKQPGRPTAELRVVDNGHGFHNLHDAWTLFAPSEKKGDPTKGGRFNLGEKVVLSFCREAKIHTTSGTVLFPAGGDREEYPRRKREQGTEFWAIIDCTTERLQQFLDYTKRLIVRPGLNVTVNGETVPRRTPFRSFKETLQTVISNNLGELGHSRRVTEVELYEPLPGEVAMLYELGVPVVETEDKWHYNVLQKVPLNADRDNVTPAYLRDLRVYVYNHTHDRISEDDTEAPWVNEATSDDKCEPEAVETFRVKKYGEKSVAYDPFNPEANNEAQAKGYTVIPSHGLTKGQRENLKINNFLLSSTQMFPTAGKGAYSDDPDAKPVTPLAANELTPGMLAVKEYTEGLAYRLLGKRVTVEFVNISPRFAQGQPWRACYGRGHLLGRSEFHYNVGVLGKRWFDGVREATDELILHELGHEFSSNHLSDEYYRGLCKLGARLKNLAIEEQEWFLHFGQQR